MQCDNIIEKTAARKTAIMQSHREQCRCPKPNLVQRHTQLVYYTADLLVSPPPHTHTPLVAPLHSHVYPLVLSEKDDKQCQCWSCTAHSPFFDSGSAPSPPQALQRSHMPRQWAGGLNNMLVTCIASAIHLKATHCCSSRVPWLHAVAAVQLKHCCSAKHAMQSGSAAVQRPLSA